MITTSRSLRAENIVRIRYVRHAAEYIRVDDVTEFERRIAVWPWRTHPQDRASGRLAFIRGTGCDLPLDARYELQAGRTGLPSLLASP